MVRATLPSVGVSSAYLPWEDDPTNPYTFETPSSAFIVSDVREIRGIGREDNKRLVQRSGSISGIVKGSRTTKLKPLVIQANLHGSSIANVRDKYDALENYIFGSECKWFGRGGYYYTLEVQNCERTLRIGGVPTLVPVTITALLQFPKATNGKPTSEAQYLALNKRSSLDEDYPVIPQALTILTPQLLPTATIGDFYFHRVIAVGDNQPLIFSKTAGFSEIQVLPNGFVIWNVPRLTGQETVTVRVTDSTSAFIERTFTIDVPGNIYADGDSGLRDGNTVLGYGY